MTKVIPTVALLVGILVAARLDLVRRCAKDSAVADPSKYVVRVYDVRDLLNSVPDMPLSPQAALVNSQTSLPPNFSAGGGVHWRGTARGLALEELADRIMYDAAGDQWDHGWPRIPKGGIGNLTPVCLREWDGRLIITETEAKHRRVEEFLLQLRQAGGNRRE